MINKFIKILTQLNTLFPIEILEHPRNQIINVRFTRKWVDLFRRRINRNVLKLVPERKRNSLFCKYSTLYLQEYIPSYADPLDEALFIINLKDDNGIVVAANNEYTSDGYPKVRTSPQQMDLLIEFLENNNKKEE